MSSFDDYPDAERRMPPHIVLYKAVVDKYEADVQSFKDRVLADGSINQGDKERVIDGGDITNVYYTEQQFPFHLDGSDAVQITSMIAPRDSDDGFVSMNVLLFADGSPFMREQDERYADTDFGESYAVYLSPERRPFIVPVQELEGHIGPNGLEYSPVAYLEYLRSSGQAPRDLSDQEAQELLATLAQLELDFDLTFGAST